MSQALSPIAEHSLQVEVIMTRPTFKLVMLATAAMVASSPAVSRPPDTWNGLMKIDSKNMQAAYLLPNADFRAYTKVLLEPAEVALAKDWLSNYNQSADLGSRISDSDARAEIVKANARTSQIFANAFQKAGYQVVTSAGADVVSIKPMILNVQVSAPDVMGAGRQYNFSPDAGQATLGLEVRDSVSRQLIGVAADSQIAGDNSGGLRTSASNIGDFTDLVATWAKQTAQGLTKLKAMSPIDAEGQPRR